MRDVSHPFPLRDGRTEADGDVIGRDVIYDFGTTEPYVMKDDGYVRAPIRISHNMASGFVLEAGDLDFSDSEFLALEQAVRKMRLLLNGNT